LSSSSSPSAERADAAPGWRQFYSVAFLPAQVALGAACALTATVLLTLVAAPVWSDPVLRPLTAAFGIVLLGPAALAVRTLSLFLADPPETDGIDETGRPPARWSTSRTAKIFVWVLFAAFFALMALAGLAAWTTGTTRQDGRLAFAGLVAGVALVAWCGTAVRDPDRTLVELGPGGLTVRWGRRLRPRTAAVTVPWSAVQQVQVGFASGAPYRTGRAYLFPMPQTELSIVPGSATVTGRPWPRDLKAVLDQDRVWIPLTGFRINVNIAHGVLVDHVARYGPPAAADTAETGLPPPARVPGLRTQLALGPADQAVPRWRTALHWMIACLIAAIPFALLAVERHLG